MAFEAASVLRAERASGSADRSRAEAHGAVAKARGRECLTAFKSGKPARVFELVQESCLALDNADLVDFDVQDDCGMTILHHACRHNEYDLIRLLLVASDGPKLKANVTVFLFNSLT